MGLRELSFMGVSRALVRVELVRPADAGASRLPHRSHGADPARTPAAPPLFAVNLLPVLKLGIG